MSIEAMKQALEAMEYADACLKKQLTTKTKHEYAQDLLMDAGIALRQAIEQAEKQEPWVWQQSPIKTQWGDDMVVASVAIDKDHTVCLYCERDQAPKVEAMFAQRTWQGLTAPEQTECYDLNPARFANNIEAKLKQKNGYAEEKNT